MSDTKLETAWDYGYGYAEHLAEDDREQVAEVSVEDAVNGKEELPDGDYVEMRFNNIEPDEREYWEGYNAYVREHA